MVNNITNKVKLIHNESSIRLLIWRRRGLCSTK